MVELEGGMNLLNSLIFEEQEMYDANKIDFDRHWKEIIAVMPDSFLLLLEPELFEQIDFATKLQPMEQELFPIHSKQG